MTDEQQKAIDNLRSNNYKLSDIIRDAVFKAAEKTGELIVASDNPNSFHLDLELFTNICKE